MRTIVSYLLDDQLEAVRGDRRALAGLDAEVEAQARLWSCQKPIWESAAEWWQHGLL